MLITKKIVLITYDSNSILACFTYNNKYFFQLNAYGGTLKYKVVYTLARGIESEGVIMPDIILTVRYYIYFLHSEILNCFVDEHV